MSKEGIEKDSGLSDPLPSYTQAIGAEGLECKTKPEKITKVKALVFMTISVNGEIIGNITFKLYDDILPLTCRNFRALCIGEKKFGYANTTIFRIKPGDYLQGGDVTKNDGSGGKSIYVKKFKDENFLVRHDRAGRLSMANYGRDTNQSLFTISFIPRPWSDKLSVGFGEVVDGFDILKRIEECGQEVGKPLKTVKMVACGEL